MIFPMYKFRYSIWFGEDKLHEQELHHPYRDVLIGRGSNMNISLAPEHLRELAIKVKGTKWEKLGVLEQEANRVSRVHGVFRVLDNSEGSYSHIGANDASFSIDLGNGRGRATPLSNKKERGSTEARFNAKCGFTLHLKGLGKKTGSPFIWISVGEIESGDAETIKSIKNPVEVLRTLHKAIEADPEAVELGSGVHRKREKHWYVEKAITLGITDKVTEKEAHNDIKKALFKIHPEQLKLKGGEEGRQRITRVLTALVNGIKAG